MKCDEISVFLENVKLLRSKNGLSKTKMAKIMGTSVKSLSKIENGIIPERMTVDVIFNLCKNFNIKPKDLFFSLFADDI